MSIGPEIKKDEDFKASIVHNLQYSTMKTVEGFFSDPLYYIFYGSLTALIIGLLNNRSYPGILYVILLLVGLMRAVKFITKELNQGN